MAAFLAGEIGRSARRGSAIPAEQILFAELSVPRIAASGGAAEFDQTEFMGRLAGTQRELIRRLREEPRVREVAVGSSVIGLRAAAPIELDEGPGGGYRRYAMTADVDPDFMTALGQPILMGRGFTPRDAGDDGLAVIVNSTFVERVLGGSNPIGRRLRYVPRPDAEPGRWHEIVGVVDDIGMNQSSPDPQRGFYRAAAPGEIYPAQLAIRLDENAESFSRRLREITREVDPAAMISDARRLDKIVLGNRMVWLSSLGGIGFARFILVVLSAAGIYALMSFTVTERTRETGIRVALGAGRSTIARIVATRAVAQIGIGVLLGIPFAAITLNQSAGIHELSQPSVLSSALIIGGGVMLVIGSIACTGPTLRALRIAPDEALRQE
jgi:putative ABC transport system permease protein